MVLNRIALIVVLFGVLLADALHVQRDSQLFAAIRDRSLDHLQSLEHRYPSMRAGGVIIDLAGLRTHLVNPMWEFYDRRYLELTDPADVTAGFAYLAGPPERRFVKIRFPLQGESVGRIERRENAVLQEGIFGVSLYGYSKPRGLWATTQRAYRCSLWISSGRHLTPEETAMLRAEAATWITGDSQEKIDAWKQTLIGDRAFAYINNPSGYLHNTLTLSLLAALLYTLASTPFALRRALRASRNACLHCAYDLTGIDSTHCPECGVAIESAYATNHRRLR